MFDALRHRPHALREDEAPRPLLSRQTACSLSSLVLAAASGCASVVWFSNPVFPGIRELGYPFVLVVAVALAALGLGAALIGLVRREGLASVLSMITCAVVAVPPAVVLLGIHSLSE